MVGWHHGLHGHEFEQVLGDGEGQGSLACYSPWGRQESDTTEQQQKYLIYRLTETSLAVQRLGLPASNAGGPGLIPGQGTKTPYTMRPK